MKTVDPHTLQQWLDKGEAVLIDVREPAEHHSQKIQGSSLIPLKNIPEKDLSSFKEKKLVIHCHSGRRSAAACVHVLEKDPDIEVYNLEGGIVAWEQAGFDTATSKAIKVPLDRQTQIAIGLLILIGSLLTLFVSPAFVYFTGFIGLGLIFAGFSGFCSLTYLLAKLPWNRS